MLLIGFGVFLVRHVVGVITGEPLSPVLLGVHVLVVLVLSFNTAPSVAIVTCPSRNFESSELVIFGLPAAFFLMLQHRVTLEDAGRGVHAPALVLLAAAHLYLRHVYPEHLAARRGS